MFSLLKLKEKSGKRDSDPRPQPWQGCALPTELFPQGKINGEEEETRTPTTQLSLPPQSSASTNSATSPTKVFIPNILNQWFTVQKCFDLKISHVKICIFTNLWSFFYSHDKEVIAYYN